jgi:ferric-dicitrate binding protein FerR (iron transport regulator)
MASVKDYKKYTFTDFLSDEDFVQSIVSPTEESRTKWKTLIDAGEVNIDEYTDAVLILMGWKDTQDAPTNADLDALWNRIETTIISSEEKATGRKHLWVRAAAVTSAIAAAIAIVLMLLPREQGTGQKTLNIAPGYLVRTMEQSDDKVVITTDKMEMYLEGSNPDISYDPNGVLSVNNIVAESLCETEGVAETDWSEEMLTSETAEQLCNIIVPYGKTASLTLSDGSFLRINAGTTVRFPSSFLTDKRKIYVDGEIYLEVVHDNRPFIVQAKGMEVLVKGTCFDVCSYDNDDYSNVVLVNGRVDVSYKGSNITLTPRQGFFATAEGTSVKVVDTDFYTSWINGIYKFKNESIEKVLVKLARFYNVTLVLPQEESGITCYGSLELKNDLSTILTGLMQIASFNFAVKDGAYFIQWNERSSNS